MLSGNGQAGPLFEVVDAGLAGIHYDTNMQNQNCCLSFSKQL